MFYLTSCSKDEAPNLTIEETDPIEVPISTAPIIDPINGNQVIGEAGLFRYDGGISMRYITSGLAPGHAYTIWWVVWNKPEACIGYPGPCASDDFEAADQVEVEIMYAAGAISGQDGRANFKAYLETNDANGSINTLFGLPKFGGLKNPMTSEIHLVLRSHGPAISGQTHEQTSSYGGGCTTNLPDFTEVPDQMGECADIHFAVFQP
ncbi:MAG: hypothetical protein DHS20C18_28910 [Saprospiraceae bacterium]|nr:MAG: hypothetical protein DHS20C18_28910 [Saprospiraceae bacterium]